MSSLVKASGADFGAVLAPDAEQLTLVDDTGRALSDGEGLLALLSLLLGASSETGLPEVGLPNTGLAEMGPTAREDGRDVLAPAWPPAEETSATGERISGIGRPASLAGGASSPVTNDLNLGLEEETGQADSAVEGVKAMGGAGPQRRWPWRAGAWS